tara:strand:+ start:1014 stop:1811 length:798 start_codon:yes stop_codon:yes gene_type:complete
VLDGFLIEGNVIKQTPFKVAKGKGHVLKKHSLAIAISVFVHLLLALSLFFIAQKQQPKQIKITQKAIKSYLYKIPSKPVNVEPVAIKEVPEEVKVKEEIKKIEVLKPENPNQAEIIKEKNLKVNEASKASSLTKTKEPVQATFSSYQQLENLRHSINEKIIAEELSKLHQFRSPSVMHGEQIPVPHSAIQLTPEQEKEKRTTKMSDNISITKYDNGVCTIEREQFPGSPVSGSSSAFTCGESKFNQSFRKHMKKVQEKLLPTKNK